MTRRWGTSQGRVVLRCLALPGAVVGGLALGTGCDGTDTTPSGIPDLQLEPLTKSGIRIAETWFSADHCAIQEACVAAAGVRRLLRFETVTANRGTGDLVIGRPPDRGVSDDTFQWSACHKHHHVPGYTLYELVDAAGHVTTSRKQAFCLQDDQNVQVGAPRRGYNCDDQGLSRGWADVYGLNTDCQWIDITDLPSADYTLRITVNPMHTLPESDYDNNELTVDVTF